MLAWRARGKGAQMSAPRPFMLRVWESPRKRKQGVLVLAAERDDLWVDPVVRYSVPATCGNLYKRGQHPLASMLISNPTSMLDIEPHLR